MDCPLTGPIDGRFPPGWPENRIQIYPERHFNWDCSGTVRCGVGCVIIVPKNAPLQSTNGNVYFDSIETNFQNWIIQRWVNRNPSSNVTEAIQFSQNFIRNYRQRKSNWFRVPRIIPRDNSISGFERFLMTPLLKIKWDMWPLACAVRG